MSSCFHLRPFSSWHKYLGSSQISMFQEGVFFCVLLLGYPHFCTHSFISVSVLCCWCSNCASKHFCNCYINWTNVSDLQINHHWVMFRARKKLYFLWGNISCYWFVLCYLDIDWKDVEGNCWPAWEKLRLLTGHLTAKEKFSEAFFFLNFYYF